MTVSTPSTPTPYPSALHAWTLVMFLTMAYILSFVDRSILGLLIEPIKADLNLTDTQIGLLLGPAFAIFYVTMGLPLGWAADRLKRIWIVAAGVIVWSAATAASGLARNFGHLFLARMSVGVGEATLSPCAMSIIADSFPPEKRGFPIAFYSASLSIGAALASLLGAIVLTWATDTGSLSLPVFGELKPWQVVFLILGIPGVAIGVVFAFLPEPKRRADDVRLIEDRNANPLDAVRYIAAHGKLFAGFISIFCVLTIIAYASGWSAPLFERTWGLQASDYALINGIILLVLGPPSISLAGFVSDRWFARGRIEAPLLVAMIGLVITVPTGGLIALMPSWQLAFVMVGLNVIGITWLSATGVTALINIVPADIRAQTIALYYMVISLAGLFLGPTAVGLLSDYVFGADNLRYAFAVVPLFFGLPVILFLPIIRKLYVQECERIKIHERE